MCGVLHVRYYMCEVLHVCDTCVRYCMCGVLHVWGTTCEVLHV